MFDRPKRMTAASGLALIGALISFVLAFISFSRGGDDVWMNIVLFMLIAVLFLAICGSLTPNGQWSWRVTLMMTFLCAIVIIFAYFFEAAEAFEAVVLFIIALLVAVLASDKNSADWIAKTNI